MKTQTKHSHLLLLAVYAIFFALGMPDGAFGVAWPGIRYEMELPLSQATNLIIVHSILYSIAASQTGRLTKFFKLEGAARSEKNEPRFDGIVYINGLGFILFLAGMAGFIFAPNFNGLIFATIFLGAGMGMIDSGCNAFAAVRFSGKHMNWLHCFWAMGGSFSPVIMRQMMIFSDWRAGYSAIFFVQLSAAVFVFFTVLKGYWKPQKKICEEKISFDSQKIFLKSKIFFAVQWIIFFLYAAAEYSVTFWTVSVLIDGRGEFFAVASLFPAVYLGSLMTGRIVFGYANNSDADPKIIRLGFFLAVIGLIVLTFSNSVVGIVLVGYGFAPIFPCLMNVTKKRFDPQSLYKSVGLQIAAAGAGVTLSAVSMGRLLEKISMAALFPAVIFFVLVSFVLNEIIEAKLKKISRELNSK